MSEQCKSIRTVAVVGVGSMGAPITRYILKAGFNLIVCDRNAEVMADFEREGARLASCPAECATADLIIVLVTTPLQASQVVLGENGIKAGILPGHAPIIAIMSTVPVETMYSLRDGLENMTGGLVDAPISGGLSRAEQGKLTIMIGGDAALVASLRPVFSKFANEIFHCGGVGSGQAMKIVNNIVGNANLVVTAEAYRIAMSLGLQLDDVARVLETSSGRNAFSADPNATAETFRAISRDRDCFNALVALMQKDISFAEQIAGRSAGQYPAISSLNALFKSLDGETYDTWRSIATTGFQRK